MDPITHSLVGAMAAKSVRAPRRRFWIMTFLGNVPDFDVVFHSFGPWAFWLQHRGISHSFLGVALQAGIFALAFSKFDAGSFNQRFAQYSIPLFLHALCDYLTSYGVPLFSPFSFDEYSANLVPAVTVIPIVFMLPALIHLNRKNLEGWRALRPVWAAWAVYLVFSMGGRAYAKHLAGPEVTKTRFVAGLVNPFRWNVVSEVPPCCAFRSRNINILTRVETKGMVVSTDMESFPIKMSLESKNIKRFSESTPWAVGRAVSLRDGGWNVEWGKIIFSSRGMVRSLWSLNVSSGGVISDEKRALNFWTPEEKPYES